MSQINHFYEPRRDNNLTELPLTTRTRQMITSGKKALTGFALALGLLSYGSAYAAAGGTIADIKARGVLTVGTEAAYEPYEFIHNDKIVGYGEDILQYMVKKLGV